MVADKPTMEVKLLNQSSKPVEISYVLLTEQSAGVTIEADHCADKTVEAYQSCTVVVRIADSEKTGQFTLNAELLNQDISARKHTYHFEKISPIEADINTHMGTEPVVEWFSGGDAIWELNADTNDGDSATPVLVNGNISDQTEDSSITEESQKSVLLGEINAGAVGIRFEYLVSSEQNYDFFTAFLNGREIVRKSGVSDAYKQVSYNLKKGPNTIAFVYSKDFSHSTGKDNVTLKGLSIKVRENQSPVITLAATEVNIRSGMEVVLDATGTSDPDEDSFTLAWTNLSAPEVVLSTDKVYTFIAPVVTETQTQIFEVTATDEYGAISKHRVAVTIGENKPPVINIAEANIEVRAGVEFTLDASTTADPDGDTLSYSWLDLSGDTSISIGNETTMKLKAGDDQVGQTLVYQFTAQDEYGAKSSQLVTVKVVENKAPQVTLIANATVVSAGQDIVLNASDSTDPEGDELTFSWEQVSGISVEVSGSGAQMSVVAPSVDKNEALEFAVTVTDSLGASSTESIQVTVEQPEKDADSSDSSGTSSTENITATAQQTEKDSGSFGSFALLLMPLLLFSRRIKK
ncbi:PKD domain-containing protein [Pseudoalteromonas viridis]